MGRPKGSLNRNTEFLLNKAELLNCDPFEILLHFANGDWKSLGFEAKTKIVMGKDGVVSEVDYITPDHRLKAASEAAQYLYPKRKAIEMKVDEETKEAAKLIVNLSGKPMEEPAKEAEPKTSMETEKALEP